MPGQKGLKNLVRVNIKDSERRIEKLIAEGISFTKVGYPEDGTIKKGTNKGSGHDDFETMSEIAYIALVNEMGATLDNGAIVPPRPFFTQAFDQNREDIIKASERFHKLVLEGTLTKKQGLSALGEYMIDLMKTKLLDGPWEPNAELTKQRKDSEQPLVDKGQLINSVQQKVTL